MNTAAAAGSSIPTCLPPCRPRRPAKYSGSASVSGSGTQEDVFSYSGNNGSEIIHDDEDQITTETADGWASYNSPSLTTSYSGSGTWTDTSNGNKSWAPADGGAKTQVTDNGTPDTASAVMPAFWNNSEPRRRACP